MYSNMIVFDALKIALQNLGGDQEELDIWLDQLHHNKTQVDKDSFGSISLNSVNYEM